MTLRIVFCMAALLLAGPGWSQGPPMAKGQLRLPEFAALTDKASESVAVTLDPQLLGLACRFLNSEDPEEAAARQLCTSLTGIYVRSYSFDTDYAYPKADIDAVRKQLSGGGWSPLVQSRKRDAREDVDVYVRMVGDRIEGLAVVASEPREFTIVNIVGHIDIDKVAMLEGQFGIPKVNRND